MKILIKLRNILSFIKLIYISRNIFTEINLYVNHFGDGGSEGREIIEVRLFSQVNGNHLTLDYNFNFFLIL